MWKQAMPFQLLSVDERQKRLLLMVCIGILRDLGRKGKCISYCPHKTQDCFNLLRGIPNCGHCEDASARNASATKWGWDWIMDFHPDVSIMSVAWLLFQFFPSLHPSCRRTLHLLIKSIAWAFNCSALCKSARTRVSATFSTERLLHKASSHMTFSRSSAYYPKENTVIKHLSPLFNM